jgi:RNA polymerase sigma-70 factor (sigma-E family)
MGARVKPADEVEFTSFVAERRDWLRRTAFLICGDWAAADDVVQDALIKLYGAWPRIRNREDPSGYARRAVVTAAISRSRRPWRREVATEEFVEVRGSSDSAHDEYGVYDDRLVLMRALARLSPRKRAHLVLRYFEQLTITETAAVLGCSTGTVKSESSKALAQLYDELSRAGLTAADVENRS